MTTTMTTTTTAPAAPTATRSLPVLLGVAGLLVAAGGQLHPRGSGATADDYLASMFVSPTWVVAHLASLAGLAVAVAALVRARRTGAFGPRVTAWLPVPIAGWSIAALELVPHLLAAGEHHDHVSGGPTPVLDLHLALQVLATPALGLTGAALAIAVARAAGTAPAWVLGAIGAVGGVAYSAAGPLIALTGDVAFSPLFAAQAGLAVWLLGTAVRLAARSRVPS
jgi:hypothetical protein